MEKRPKLVILQAKKPVNLQLFFTVYTLRFVYMFELHIVILWCSWALTRRISFGFGGYRTGHTKKQKIYPSCIRHSALLRRKELSNGQITQICDMTVLDWTSSTFRLNFEQKYSSCRKMVRSWYCIDVKVSDRNICSLTRNITVMTYFLVSK